MTDFEECLDGLIEAVPAEAEAAGVDPKAVLDGMMSEFMIGQRDYEIGIAGAVGARESSEYHAPAETGMMRTSGIGPDEFERVRSDDPSAYMKLKTDYMATI